MHAKWAKPTNHLQIKSTEKAYISINPNAILKQ